MQWLFADNLSNVISSASYLFPKSAVIQVLAGSKQRELQASSMQLMHQYCPWAALFLCIMLPIMEPMGWHANGAQANPDSMLNYHFTVANTLAIGATAILGTFCSCWYLAHPYTI